MSTWELAKTLPVPDIENTNKNSIFQKAGSSPFSLTKASQKENETGTSYGDIRSGNEKDSTSSQSTGIKKESVNDLAGSTFQKAKYFSDTDEGREAEDCLSVNTGNIAKAQRVVDNDKKVLPPTARKVPTFGASKSSVPKLAPKFSCRPFTKKSVSSVNSGTKTGPNQNEKKSKTDSLSLTPVSSSSLRDDQARSTQSNFVADTKNSVEAFKPSFSVTDTLKSANDPKHSEVKTSLGIKNSTKQSGGEKENAPSSSKKENKITAKNLDTNQDLSKNVIDKGDAQFDHSQNGNDDMKTSFAKRQETSHLEVDKVISDGEKENVTSNITVDIEKIDPSPMAVEANDDREYRSTSPQAELEAQKPISMSPSEPFNNDKDKMSKACKKHPLKSSKVTDIAKTFTSEDSHMDWNDFFSLVINNVMEEKDHKEKSKLTPSRKKNRNYRAATEPKGEMSSLVDKDSLKAKITKKRKSSVGDKVTDKRETTHISGRANFDRLPKKRSSSEPASTHRENKRQRSVSAYEPLQGNKKEVDAISSPSTLAHKEKIRDMLQKNFDNWVQCDQCKKWRKLLPSIDPPALPSKWKCELNENREENACSVPEADWNKENVYVFDSFIPGSVVWARVVGTAWCPALVDIDPDFLVATWLDDAMRNVAYYHVTFFGEPVSRAWVTASNIVEFRETDTHKRFFSRGLKVSEEISVKSLQFSPHLSHYQDNTHSHTPVYQY
ncbi:hypothetical protein SK128_025602 [Halocaridina rubra]|uniref:Zinc finger CW-type PWWP domain protein 1 n=1 Tax=Halocaridina rubra TaxID=373956 RepID=A0AAN8WM10_HALRR